MSDLHDLSQRRGSFRQTVAAVAWSFLGIRRSSDHARDVAKLNPVHVIISGIVGALLFVGLLMLVVNWVVSGSAAGP